MHLPETLPLALPELHGTPRKPGRVHRGARVTLRIRHRGQASQRDAASRRRRRRSGRRRVACGNATGGFESEIRGQRQRQEIEEHRQIRRVDFDPFASHRVSFQSGQLEL